MKRRDFLKILGVAPAIAAVPALAKIDDANSLKKGMYDVKVDTPKYLTATHTYDLEDQLSYLDKMNEAIAKKGKPEILPVIKIENEEWKPEWGSIRHTANGSYKAGDIIVRPDGRIHRSMVKV